MIGRKALRPSSLSFASWLSSSEEEAEVELEVGSDGRLEEEEAESCAQTVLRRVACCTSPCSSGDSSAVDLHWARTLPLRPPLRRERKSNPLSAAAAGGSCTVPVDVDVAGEKEGEGSGAAAYECERGG